MDSNITTNGTENNTQQSLVLANANGAVQTVQAPILPVAREVARGKGTVIVQDFALSGNARQVKAAIKANSPVKLSNKAIKRLANAQLKGEGNVRNQLAAAWLQAEFQSGGIATVGERTANGFVLRGITVEDEPVVIVQEPVEESARVKELEAKLAALEAKLAAANVNGTVQS